MLDSPVAISVFNRPESTAPVFDAIRRARPRQLFVFADGPRNDEEAARCAEARAITEDVDWPAEVHRDYSDVNLGARRRYATGVDWVFRHVEEAIVFDDDCLPDDSFFPFCAEMLDRYRDDPGVMMVCGTNYLERWKDRAQSYHFSIYGSVWGWATWRRAWALYDSSMSSWSDPVVRERVRSVIADDEQFEIQARRFDRVVADEDRHSWDLPWYLTRLANAGSTIVPAVNLVVNLGNADGRGLPAGHPLANLPAGSLEFPLRHPDRTDVDRDHDRRHLRRVFDWWDEQAAAREAAERRRRSIPRRAARAGRRMLLGREQRRLA